MEDLYKALGLQPDADAQDIARAVAAHPEKKNAAAVLQDPLLKAEYDEARRAMLEIGLLRAGLRSDSAHWREHQGDFVRDEQAGETVRKCRRVKQGDMLFRVLFSLLLAAGVFLFFNPSEFALRGGLTRQRDARSVESSQSVRQEEGSRSTESPEAWKKTALSGIASFGDKYYKVFDSRQIAMVDSWADASRFCQQNKGLLAVIESAEENAFIYAWLQSQGAKDVYFGLTDQKNEGVWCSPTKGKATYLNWAPGEPNNEFGNEDYVLFYHRSPPGFWNDGRPGRDFLFLCQWDNTQAFRAYEERMGGRAPDIHRAKDGTSPAGSRAAAASDKAALPGNIAGLYKGSYQASQGETGLTLHIEQNAGVFSAVFEFYPVGKAKTRSNSGSYIMDVHVDEVTGEIILRGKTWIERPQNYGFVHLRGRFSGDRLSGKVFSDFRSGTRNFSVVRKGGA